MSVPDPATTHWVPVGSGSVGVPAPVVNGEWVKGAGGAAVWSPIVATDIADAGLSVSGDGLTLVAELALGGNDTGAGVSGGAGVLRTRSGNAFWTQWDGRLTFYIDNVPICSFPNGYNP
jgi:hypothetical protein